MSNSIFKGMSLDKETFTCVDREAAYENVIDDRERSKVLPS